MITEQTDPVAWYLLVCELEDAQDGIDSLFKDMLAKDGEFSEVEFAIHMRHIYGHLNRAWNRRLCTDKWVGGKELLGEHSSFPGDLVPF